MLMLDRNFSVSGSTTRACEEEALPSSFGLPTASFGWLVRILGLSAPFSPPLVFPPLASSFDLPSSRLGLMKPLPTFFPPLPSYNLMAADSSPLALDKHSRKRVTSGPIYSVV